MKKILLVLSLAGTGMSLASDEIVVRRVGGKLVEIPTTPVTLDDYILAVSRLPGAIETTEVFEDLSPAAVRRNGGWGFYLADLLNKDRNRAKLRDTAGRRPNPKRVESRVALNQLLRPIQNGLQYAGLQNVAVVEYLLNTLISNHKYSYEKMSKMEMVDKQAILDEIVSRYVGTLDRLEVSV